MELNEALELSKHVNSVIKNNSYGYTYTDIIEMQQRLIDFLLHKVAGNDSEFLSPRAMELETARQINTQLANQECAPMGEYDGKSWGVADAIQHNSHSPTDETEPASVREIP